ncbi:MAG TPA: ATP synthase F1 subunit gamma [Candidatus Paceibacterota bacterium]
MESIQYIKSRLGAVNNIGTITRAMEVVSATKMRKSQGLALESRPYAYATLKALADLLLHAPSAQLENSALIAPRKLNLRGSLTSGTVTLLVLVASDRGLAGSFNTNVMRTADKYINENPGDYRVILVGKKLAGWATRNKIRVEMMFTDFGDYADPAEVSPLSSLVVEGFLVGNWNKVVAISTHFKTTLNQVTLTRELLPMHIDMIKDTVREIVPEHGRYSEYRNDLVSNLQFANRETEYIFEPSPEKVLETLLPHLLNMQLFHLILEANASEHSARMVAMKNASENASELSGELTLEFNKARQATITKEMIEITSAII